MKKYLTLFIALFISMQMRAQTSDDVLIKNTLIEQAAAWNAGDLNRFMETYWHNDSLMFLGKNGPTYGWENTLKNYKKGYPDTAAMGKLNFDLISVKRLSVLYYSVVGKWHLKRSIGDLNGAFTLILKKVKKKWVIVQDHSS